VRAGSNALGRGKTIGDENQRLTRRRRAVKATVWLILVGFAVAAATAFVTAASGSAVLAAGRRRRITA